MNTTILVFGLGFIACFILLLIVGRMQRLISYWKRAKMQSGANEKVRQREHVVAVLNSGTPKKRVIDTRPRSLWTKFKAAF